MSKVIFKASQELKDKFMIVDAETGEVLGAKLYSAKGARIAASRLGHLFDAPPVEPKAETPKLPDAEVLRLHAEMQKLVGVSTDAKGKSIKSYDKANEFAKANGFPNSYVLARVAAAIKYSTRAPVAEATKPTVSSETSVETTAVSSDSWDHEMANAMARANGFDRYREVKRIVEGKTQDVSAEEKARALSVKAMIVAAQRQREAGIKASKAA